MMLNPRITLIVASLVGLLAAPLFPGCSSTRKVDDSKLREVSTLDLREMIEKDLGDSDHLILIDARPNANYELGHIPTAVNIRPAEIGASEGRDRRLTGHRYIVVYGDHPNSAVAKATAKRLYAMKYKGVRLYDEGLEGWRRAGLPIEKD